MPHFRPLALILLILVACVAALNGARAPFGGTPRAAAASGNGTLVGVRGQGRSSVLLVRFRAAQVQSVQLGGTIGLVARGGRALTVTDLRLGDRLAITPNRSVEDTSQSPATVTGVISDAVAADLVVVHGIASQDIVADIASHTSITDWAQGPISLQEITEGDVVTVQGIIDRALGEITVTDSLTRYVP